MSAPRVALRVASLARSAAAVFAGAAIEGPLAEGDAAVVHARRLSRTARDLCRAHGVVTRVTGAPIVEPAVYVANHLGYHDPLVVAQYVPCVAIAKAEVERWPVIGPVGRSLGVVFVRRESPRSGARALFAALRALGAGVSVLNFPEGTTTQGDRLAPFKRGIFGLARIAGVPVVPVRIDYDDPALAWYGPALFLPHYLGAAARPRVDVRVRFGVPISPRGLSTAALAEAARAALERDPLPARPPRGPRALSSSSLPFTAASPS